MNDYIRLAENNKPRLTEDDIPLETLSAKLSSEMLEPIREALIELLITQGIGKVAINGLAVKLELNWDQEYYDGTYGD